MRRASRSRRALVALHRDTSRCGATRAVGSSSSRPGRGGRCPARRAPALSRPGRVPRGIGPGARRRPWRSPEKAGQRTAIPLGRCPLVGALGIISGGAAPVARRARRGPRPQARDLGVGDGARVGPRVPRELALRGATPPRRRSPRSDEGARARRGRWFLCHCVECGWLGRRTRLRAPGVGQAVPHDGARASLPPRERRNQTAATTASAARG